MNLGPLLRRFHACPSRPLRRRNLPPRSRRHYSLRACFVWSDLSPYFRPARSLGSRHSSRGRDLSAGGALSVGLAEGCQCGSDSAQLPGQAVLFLLQKLNDSSQIGHSVLPCEGIVPRSWEPSGLPSWLNEKCYVQLSSKFSHDCGRSKSGKYLRLCTCQNPYAALTRRPRSAASEAF